MASSSGHQPKFAALNRGCHLYLAVWPSHWALAHTSSFCFFFGIPMTEHSYVENLTSKTRSCAFFLAECVSNCQCWLVESLIPLSQVLHGYPHGLHLSGSLTEAVVFLWWFCLGSACTACPRKRSWLQEISTETWQLLFNLPRTLCYFC